MHQVPREKLVAERARLEEVLAGLRREWDGVPKLAGGAVLAVPALLLGPLAAFLVFVAALTLVGVTAYLVGFRIREARHDIAIVQREIDRLDHLERAGDG